MKKMILLSSILAAGALFAEDAAPTPTPVASTEVGVMGLTTPSKAMLFAVPFLGYTTDAITVADMVNTAQLTEGSKLYVPNTSGKYDVWTLTDGKWTKTDTNVVIGANGAETGDGPNAVDVTTDRGGAFWLEPPSGSSGDGTFYLLGKPAADKGTSTAVGEKWNLVGNTSDAAVNLKDLSGANFDQIAVQVDGILRYYTYKIGKGWRYQDSDGAWVSDNVTIQLGRGLWYKPASDTTIDWSNGMVKLAAQ